MWLILCGSLRLGKDTTASFGKCCPGIHMSEVANESTAVRKSLHAERSRFMLAKVICSNGAPLRAKSRLAFPCIGTDGAAWARIAIKTSLGASCAIRLSKIS